MSPRLLLAALPVFAVCVIERQHRPNEAPARGSGSQAQSPERRPADRGECSPSQPFSNPAHQRTPETATDRGVVPCAATTPGGVHVVPLPNPKGFGLFSAHQESSAFANSSTESTQLAQQQQLQQRPLQHTAQQQPGLSRERAQHACRVADGQASVALSEPRTLTMTDSAVLPVPRVQIAQAQQQAPQVPQVSVSW